MTIQVSITASGRMSLPAEIRKRLGLSEGGRVFLEETEDGVMLRTVTQAVAHAQSLAKRFTGDKAAASVESFLSSRRSETGE